jgi:hypothetical protein
VVFERLESSKISCTIQQQVAQRRARGEESGIEKRSDGRNIPGDLVSIEAEFDTIISGKTQDAKQSK